MTIILHIALLSTLLIISYQDFKERMVWAILFPVFAVCGGILFFLNSQASFFGYSLLINLSFVTILLSALFFYARFLRKENLLTLIGLGDILFFIAMAISFPTFSFLNFFVFSILLTLVISILLKLLKWGVSHTIPLAGGMSFFLTLVFLLHWSGHYPDIYLL